MKKRMKSNAQSLEQMKLLDCLDLSESEAASIVGGALLLPAVQAARESGTQPAPGGQIVIAKVRSV